jgi:hypothetical protein
VTRIMTKMQSLKLNISIRIVMREFHEKLLKKKRKTRFSRSAASIKYMKMGLKLSVASI